MNQSRPYRANEISKQKHECALASHGGHIWERNNNLDCETNNSLSGETINNLDR